MWEEAAAVPWRREAIVRDEALATVRDNALGGNEMGFGSGSRCNARWGPRVGKIRGELSLAEERSSISASLLNRAERPFRGEVGMAEEAKTGYQTATCWLGREFLSGTGLPNTP